MADDPRRAELISKLAAYCADEYGGDYGVLFRATDRDRDALITTGELTALLAAAGVGNRLTRYAWARAVIAELDHDGDGMIAFAEFEAVLKPQV